MECVLQPFQNNAKALEPEFPIVLARHTKLFNSCFFQMHVLLVWRNMGWKGNGHAWLGAGGRSSLPLWWARRGAWCKCIWTAKHFLVCIAPLSEIGRWLILERCENLTGWTFIKFWRHCFMGRENQCFWAEKCPSSLSPRQHRILGF